MTCSSAAITILLVEDDKDTNEIAGRILSLKFPKCTFYFAMNGREGVDLFKKHSVDIVITDIDMPVMDGIQMTVEIKEIKADTKIIVLSGSNDKSRLEKLIKINVDKYITKPVIFDRLFAAIESCIAALAPRQNR